jgi:hypothetical protein
MKGDGQCLFACFGEARKEEGLGSSNCIKHFRAICATERHLLDAAFFEQPANNYAGNILLPETYGEFAEIVILGKKFGYNIFVFHLDVREITEVYNEKHFKNLLLVFDSRKKHYDVMTYQGKHTFPHSINDIQGSHGQAIGVAIDLHLTRSQVDVEDQVTQDYMEATRQQAQLDTEQARQKTRQSKADSKLASELQQQYIELQQQDKWKGRTRKARQQAQVDTEQALLRPHCPRIFF